MSKELSPLELGRIMNHAKLETVLQVLKLAQNGVATESEFRTSIEIVREMIEYGPMPESQVTL